MTVRMSIILWSTFFHIAQSSSPSPCGRGAWQQWSFLLVSINWPTLFLRPVWSGSSVKGNLNFWIFCLISWSDSLAWMFKVQTRVSFGLSCRLIWLHDHGYCAIFVVETDSSFRNSWSVEIDSSLWNILIDAAQNGGEYWMINYIWLTANLMISTIVRMISDAR